MTLITCFYIVRQLFHPVNYGDLENPDNLEKSFFYFDPENTENPDIPGNPDNPDNHDNVDKPDIHVAVPASSIVLETILKYLKYL